MSYWRVSEKFWTDPAVLQWSDDGRMLALYLLTCPHRTTEGLFRLPKAYIAADLGWSQERLAEPFGELLRDGFIDYDEDVSLCLILNALRYQSPDNPNQVKAALRCLADLPPSPRLACTFKGLAERFCERLAEELPEGFGNPPSLSPSPAPPPSPSPGESESAQDSDEPLPDVSDAFSADVVDLCDRLADAIEGNGCKRPTVTQRWLKDCQLMLDKDERTVTQVERAIDWSQNHHFWRSNILSMGKLRSQFETLRLQALAEKSNGQRVPTRPSNLALLRESLEDEEMAG